MRAAPALRITVRRFGAWRVFLMLALTAAAASLLGWVLLPQRAPDGVAAALAAAGVVAVAAAATLLRCRSVTLRWDGQAWRLHAGTMADHAALAGDVSVAMDLGGWMLLRFMPRPPWGWQRGHWLPVQRRGLEADWHAFRCTVYSPRPKAGDDSDKAVSESRARAESHA